jgi:hypothetical protein
MSNEEILEGNKLIAEFMGFEFTKHGNVWIPNLYPKEVHRPNSGETTFGIENLLFNSSWDWLMPVVEKIGSLETNMCGIVLSMFYEGDIYEVWLHVVSFIEWYNQAEIYFNQPHP